jgi:hypothetical protein
MSGEPLTTDIPFNCPLCGSNQCLSVVVKRTNGDYYRTAFYRCAGCTVMFLNPEKFSKQIRYTFDSGRKWAGEEPMRPDAFTRSPLKPQR